MDTIAHTTYHVLPHNGRWAVKRAGARRASAVFASKAEAIARGTELARAAATELVVHASSGVVQKPSAPENGPRHIRAADGHPRAAAGG